MVEAARKVGREWKIAEIKRQIAAGTYDTPDKVEGAIDKLLSRLQDQPLKDDGDESPPRQPR
jgi:hypothetical protein